MMSLEGIRVLDWTIYQQGPVASVFLADLGADVIKVEAREAGDPGRGVLSLLKSTMPKGPTVNAYFETLNRNKRGITIDLRKDRAGEIVYRLVEKCDVFVHNFRKHVPEKLGLGYEVLSRINPRLVYAVGSTFGPEGPEAGNPAVDLIAQARSGIMSGVTEPHQPPRLTLGGLADQVGGTTLALGILAALIARDRTGKGQKVEASLLGSMCWLQWFQLSFALQMDTEMKILDRRKARNPLWNHYPCQDGKWIILAMLDPEKYWVDFCRAIGREDLVTDPRCKDMVARSKNAKAVVEMLDETFMTRPRDEWIRTIRQAGDFVVDRVSSMPEVVADPQVLLNGYVADYDHPVHGALKIVGPPLHLSENPATVRKPAPALGQHTDEILSEIAGYSRQEIERFRADQII